MSWTSSIALRRSLETVPMTQTSPGAARGPRGVDLEHARVRATAEEQARAFRASVGAWQLLGQFR